jgi:hypothetical protein
MPDLTINNANRIRDAINLLTNVLDNATPRPIHHPMHKAYYALVQDFLDSCCDVDVLNISEVNDLHLAHIDHSFTHDRTILSKNQFGRILTGMGYPIVRRSGKYVRSGLSLR